METINITQRRENITEWLLLLIALLTLGATMAVWYSVERARVTAVEHERLDALSKILVKDVAVNLNAINNAVAGVIRDRLDQDTPVNRVAVTARLRALVEAMPGLRGLMVLDASANVIASIPSDLVGRNFAGRPYFTAPKQHGDAGMLYLAPPFRSIRGDIVMTASRIVPGPGAFQGVVTAVLDPNYFSDILHTALYAPDLRVTIAHSDGSVFVDVGARAPSNARQEALRAGAAVVPTGLRADAAIGLAVQRDLAMVQAPLNRQASAFAALCAALALVCAVALAWSQGRRRRLRQAEHDRAQERLEADAISASEARFRTLIEEAPVAVAIARRGRFVYTNRRYNLLHGYTEEEDLTGMAWRAMIAPASLRDLNEEVACMNVDAAVEQRFEAIGLGKDDTEIPVLKATTRVTLGDGPATLIFVQDITAQKTAELCLLDARDAAQAANRSKAEFLANMSHEIRTPLNAILGMAYLLERGNRDSGAASMLQKIRMAGRSLLGIINDILDVSKIEAGAMVIERSWFNLQDVIDTVAASMGVAAGDKPIALVIHPLPPAVACVLGDALRIEQLLLNLTSNAIKFTESGRIELTVTAQLLAGGHADVLFRVSDTGIGIDAAQRDNIFAPFIQADSSTTRRFGGTGLGLAICKQLVELMGGRIGVDSTPGLGSTFWFALPLPARPAASSSSAPEMVDLDVVIDAASETTRAVLADTARALGWQVRGASRERSAVPPAVAILDWQLGEDACLAAARAIRADPDADASAIIVLISTFQATGVEIGQMRPLADALLTTPVTASTLYNAVIEARHISGTREERSARPDLRQGLSGARILVVDDSGINRDVAERILREEGATVFLAQNGRSAIDWLVAHPDTVDLVLMDVQMPVMDGIEATRILRGMAQFADLPIVALTAGAFSSHQEAARNAGMDHFIAKPFDIPVTIDLIRRLTLARGAAVPVVPAPVAAVPAPPDRTGPLDMRRGLKIWGTRANYQRYLQKFAIAYGDVIARLQQDLNAGNAGAVAALAHKLTGAAANVALPAVSLLAQQFAAAPGPALLAELDAAMGAALDAIAGFAPPLAPAIVPAHAAATSQVALAPLFEQMIASLEEGMPEPALLALAALAPHVAPSALAPVLACIDDFDWPGATRHTAALAEHHRDNLTG
jgi:PAS domain S-box-containing protein